MSLGRKFWNVTRYARAARFWLLLALAALAWLGFGGQARAQSNSCPSTAAGCTQEQAWASCKAGEASLPVTRMVVPGSECQLQTQGTLNNFWFRHCIINQFGNCQASNQASSLHYFGSGCPAGQQWFAGTVNQCQQTCSSRSAGTFTPIGSQIVRNGSTGCRNNCKVSFHSNGDGTFAFNHSHPDAGQCLSLADQACTTSQQLAGWHNNFNLGMCVPPVEDCAPGETKNPHTGECQAGCPAGMVLNALGECHPEADQCPAGNIRAPSGECLPGEGQCAAGEARKPDGTCGRDSDGDGTADDFDPDTDSTSFSGGDNCNAPPACNGDAIMCGQARIQWRIDCNTRDDAKVSGGSCAAVPICVGKNCKALEYSQLLQQWKASCALEKLAQGGPTGGGDGQPAWTQVSGDGSEGAGPEPEEGDFKKRLPLGINLLDQSGLGISGSCPSFGVIDLGWLGTFDIDSFDWICQFVSVVGTMIFLMGCFTALVILFKG